MKKTIKGFVDSEGNEYQYKDEIARSQNQNLEEEINSNKTYMDKVKTELKNDNKTLNGRIDTILTGTVNTTKLVTVHSATIRNNSASDLTFKISSKDNETLKSIKDKSPTVINANVIAKALDGVAINGKGIPSSYNVESTNDEYVITVYSGSSSVVGQYVFMAVVTIAYEDIATDISSAELKDVRAGADGTVYKSAGEAVRQQIGSLKSDTSRIKKSLKTTYVDMNLFALGTINKDTGEEESSNKILRSIIDVNATEDITIKLPKGYQWNVAHWLAGKYRSDLWNENGWYQNLTIEKTTANYKYRILIRRSDGADITLSELIGAAETNREDLQSFDKIDDLKKKLNEVDKKVDNLSTETDTTLTKTGKAADSAVVGKEIGSLKESLDNQSTSVSKIENSLFKESDYEEIEPIETLNGKIYESDGKLHDGTGYYSAKYSTQDVKKIKIRNWAGGNIPLLVFFLNDTYLSCYKPETGWSGAYLEIDIPSSANFLYAQGTDNGIYTEVAFKTIDTSYNIREQIEKIEESLGDVSPNLYNEKKAKKNVAISQTNGEEMSGFDGWLATGYIPVSKGDVLYFSSNGEPTRYSTGAFFDKDKQRVDSFGNPNNNNNITVTTDGYARFSFGTVPVNLQIEKGSRTTYVPYGELKVKTEVDNVKEDVANIKIDVTKTKTEVAKIQEDHTNLFNKDTVVKGAVLADSGYFDSSFSDWDSSDYIPVKPGMVLYFSSNELPIGVASVGAYFDADKKYLSGVNNNPTVLTVPEGAYYLRFSKNGGLGDTLNTLKIEQHGITKFTPYGESYVVVNESALPNSILPKWKGLKILTLGDSITAMGGVNGWTHWIKQYLLADKVVNVSVAGSTWQDKVVNQTYDGNPQPSTDGNVMGNQVQKVLNAKVNGDADYQDFDVITFSFGTNDSVDFSVQTKESVENQFIMNYAQNNFTVVPLESVNRQTLAGAMRYGFQKLHEAYPNAVIFMCTPTQECYETFDSIYQKGDFINYVADRLGAETINTRRCGIRNIYESQTTIDYDHPEQSGAAPIQTDLLDGIHTNENGAKKIAKYNAREIMKYFMIN